MENNYKDKIKYLEDKAQKIRTVVIEMYNQVGKGHIGGSLSVVELMTALYFHIINVNPENPNWPDRDRVILSKGHASSTLYAILAEKGFFPKNYLFTQFVKINGILQEHCEMRKTPGVEMSTGSLGQGLSVALGMSLASRLNKKNYRIYVIMGDGEMQSGQVWEALMACSHYKTKNIIVIIDYNKLQISGTIGEIMDIEPLVKKLNAFRWNVLEIDGHNMTQIVQAFQEVEKSSSPFPHAIICNTIKGKGISFMENNVGWHSNLLTKKLYEQAMEELSKHNR